MADLTARRPRQCGGGESAAARTEALQSDSAAGRALVVGYGNPLRADDGLGWEVARRLAAADLPADVVTAHQLTPELAEAVSRASLVVFVDAREDGAPGRVGCERVGPAGAGVPTFSHELDPPALLGLARALYGARPEAVAVSVVGHDFGHGTGLTPEVEAALPGAVELVRALVAGRAPAAASALAAVGGPARPGETRHA